MKPLYLSFLIGLCLLPISTFSQEVRKNARSNPEVVEKYREAVKRMKDLSETDPDDPRSWLYQAGLHRHIRPGQVTKESFATIGLNLTDAQIAEMRKYALVPPPHAVKNETWDQCHRSNPDTVFLAWHRVYAMYFEQIARNLLGDPSFSLPYWAYNQGGDAASLPSQFRTATYQRSPDEAPIANPLYAPRERSINDGAPLAEEAMPLDGLRNTEFAGFQRDVELDPHNLVHGVVGDSQTTLLMALPNWAAQDPIFWLHHINIDRIWAAWEKVHTTPSDLGGDEKYQFVKGDGTVVTHTGKELYKLAREISYTYDNLDDIKVPADQPIGHLLTQGEVAQPNTASPAHATAAPRKRLLADSVSSEIASRVTLGPEKKTFPLSVGPLVRSALDINKMLAPNAVPLDAPTTAPRTSLILENITANKLVNEPFVVQVKKPNEAPVTVGTFTFFAPVEAFLSQQPGDAAHHTGHAARPTIEKVTLDLNAALQKLNVTSSKELGELEVSIVPYSTLQNEKRGEPNKKASIPPDGVEIGSIRLELTIMRGAPQQ